MRAYFTVCNTSYLHKALSLAESLYENTQYRLKVFLFEEGIPNSAESVKDFADIILAKDIGYDRFYELAFKYDVTEFTTSLKPYIAKKLLNDFTEVVFLDPDTFVTGQLNEISEWFVHNDIILTPHYCTPETTDVSIDPDLGMMRFGSFNLGFFAVKNTPNSSNFLMWWHERCEEQCYFETQFGLSTDQKWISIAPCFFEKIYIVRHLGYNVAFWNLFERKIKSDHNKHLVNDEYEIQFLHFSSFDDIHPEKISTRWTAPSELISDDMKGIAANYKMSTEKYRNFLAISDLSYSYDSFTNGDKIAVVLRRAYAADVNKFQGELQMFSENSPVHKFARKNNLISGKDGSSYKPASFGDLPKHETKMKFVYFVLKIMLFFLGPNKFNDLSRLMVFLSSYRRLSKMWRV